MYMGHLLNYLVSFSYPDSGLCTSVYMCSKVHEGGPRVAIELLIQMYGVRIRSEQRGLEDHSYSANIAL